ncbi:MAG: hypothetical protein ACOCQD_01860 [archaeon]
MKWKESDAIRWTVIGLIMTIAGGFLTFLVSLISISLATLLSSIPLIGVIFSVIVLILGLIGTFLVQGWLVEKIIEWIRGE